jgi:membrane protein EpsK
MAACRGVSAVFSLLLVPIVISKLGLTGFGTWEILFSVAILTSMFQAATSNTMLWQISNAYGLQDETRVRRLLQIGISITLVQFIVFVPAVWVLRHHLVACFHVTHDMLGAAALMLPLLCGMMILNGINECIGAVISGYQHTGLVTLVQSIAQVANYCVSVCCLMSGLGLLSMLIGYSANYVVACIMYLLVARRHCPRLRLLPTVPSRSEVAELYGYFSLVMIGSISGVLRDEKDKLVLTSFFSPLWTGYYSISLRLISCISLMSTFFYVPVMAAVGALNSRGDWDSIRRIYSNAISIIAVFVGLTAVVIAGLHERILLVWIGKDIPEVGTILLWLVFGNITAILLTGPGTALCRGIGRMGMEAGYWVIGIIINTLLTIVLIKASGAIGSVAASALSWAISSMFFLWFMHNNIDLPWTISFRSVKVLAIVFVTIGLVHFLSANWPVSSNHSYAVCSTALLAMIAVVCYVGLLMATRTVPSSIRPILSLLNRQAK